MIYQYEKLIRNKSDTKQFRYDVMKPPNVCQLFPVCYSGNITVQINK